MVFDFVDEVMKFYTRYAKEKGFAVCKRTSSKGNDGEMRYATITCNRGRKQKIRSSNLVKLQPQLKTSCKQGSRQIYALVESGEKQFQSAYTRAKFKESQREILGKIYCDWTTCKEDGGISEYTIDEYVKVGESHQCATFIVVFKDDTKEVNCNCRLFEFRGILCKHQITVFMHRKIDQVPEKYILRRRG
ncbi:hypothetical protein ACSBR1_006127 [Camellia fascicularis]